MVAVLAKAFDQNPGLVAELQRRVIQMLPSLPLEVQRAWKVTQNTPVYNNEPGAFPTPILPNP